MQALYPTFDYRLEEPDQGQEPARRSTRSSGASPTSTPTTSGTSSACTGEGITVANIDTGVQYDHPALVDQYRGNNGDGTFDHNYNWFDAAGTCATAPCDTNGHGTHTMGTMVGDDGAANQIGVAPGAKWIAANGCCPSDAALIASGQWMLAPTDLDGREPRRRPSGRTSSTTPGARACPSNDPFMEDIELAWAASGIFGTWSNGNSGPDLPDQRLARQPDHQLLGRRLRHQQHHRRLLRARRGPGRRDQAQHLRPGVNVRSSLPGSTYGAFNGTSMAAPHVAGAVALLWSAAPSLVGDIDAHPGAARRHRHRHRRHPVRRHRRRQQRLRRGPARRPGPGAARRRSGDTGTLAGTVTDAATGDPLDGATVDITGEAEPHAHHRRGRHLLGAGSPPATTP